MRVLLYGATGMVGSGVLHECLNDAGVVEVVAVGRTPTGMSHPKLKELVRKDLTDYVGLDKELKGFDACFWCLGITSVGTSEADYRRITRDLTIAAGKALERLNPGMAFVFVSGAGSDAASKTMWRHVKGEAENAVLGMELHSFVFRPGIIQPLDGAKSKTRLYRALYVAFTPVMLGLRLAAPNTIVTTRGIGRAMLRVARSGWPTRILEQRDLVAASKA